MERIAAFKIKAFTILELMVALMISSLVIILGYSVFDTVNQLYLFRMDEHAKVEERLTIYYLLNKDLSESDRIMVQKNDFTAIKNFNEIKYSCFDEEIVREQAGITDTFEIEIELLDTYREGRKITVGIIDSIAINMESGQKFQFLFKKEYSAATKMKIESNEY